MLFKAVDSKHLEHFDRQGKKGSGLFVRRCRPVSNHFHFVARQRIHPSVPILGGWLRGARGGGLCFTWWHDGKTHLTALQRSEPSPLKLAQGLMCTCDAEACQIYGVSEKLHSHRTRKETVFSVRAVSVRGGLIAAAAAVFYIIDPFAGGIVSQFKDDCHGWKLARKPSEMSFWGRWGGLKLSIFSLFMQWMSFTSVSWFEVFNEPLGVNQKTWSETNFLQITKR